LYHATHMPIFSELKNNHMGVNSQRHWLSSFDFFHTLTSLSCFCTREVSFTSIKKRFYHPEDYDVRFRPRDSNFSGLFTWTRQSCLSYLSLILFSLSSRRKHFEVHVFAYPINVELIHRFSLNLVRISCH
jgi:hypothetical protein